MSAVPPSALGAWIGMAQSTRLGLTNGPPPVDTSMSSLLTYFQPLVAYVAFMIIFTVITAVSGLAQCCCLCCCKKSIRRKQARRDPPSPKQKYFIFALLGLLFFAWFVGATVVFSSSPYMTASLASMQSSLVASITDVKLVFNGISPAVVTAVGKLQKQLPNEIQVFSNSINRTAINETIRDPLLQIATDLDASQTNITSIKSLADTVFASRATLISSQGTIEILQGYVTGNVSDLSTTPNSLASNPAITWKRTNALPAPATIGASLASVKNIQSPDGRTAISSVSTLDLSSYASDVRVKGNNATTSVAGTVDGESAKVTLDVDKSFAKVNTSVTESIGPMTNDFNTAANDFVKTINDIFEGPIKQFDNARNGVMIAIAVLFYLIIVVIGFGTFRKKPKVMKGCNLASTLFYVLFFIFGIIVLIFAVVLGLSCKLVFDDRSQGPLNSIGAKASVDQVFNFQTQCYANKSLLQAASNLGIVNSTSTNLTAQTETKLNEQDYSALTKWNSSSSVSLSESPADKTAAIRNMDLSSLTQGIADLTTAISSTIPALSTDLDALLLTVNNANTAAAAGDLTFTGGPTVAQETEALNAYKAKLTAIANDINSEKALLTTISNTCNTLKTDITSLRALALSTNTTALSFQVKYDQLLANFAVLESQIKTDLSTALPKFRSSVLSYVSTLESDINVALNCRIIAVDISAIQNATCGDALSSMDAVWLALIYLAMLSMLSIPIVIWSANVLYPLDRTQIHDVELVPTDDDQGEFQQKNYASAPPMQDRILRTGVADE